MFKDEGDSIVKIGILLENKKCELDFLKKEINNLEVFLEWRLVRLRNQSK